MKPKALERWIWILVYGGLLCSVVGLAVAKQQENLGYAMAAAGGIAAGVGALLIVVRARMK
jgi:hypothetical protein